MPSLPLSSLNNLAERSSRLKDLLNDIVGPMTAVPPYGLGFPSDTAQSAYYPGQYVNTQEDIARVSRTLEEHSILPENTRIRKLEGHRSPMYEVLQASVELDPRPVELPTPKSGETIRILRGDHSKELAKICSCLSEATKHAANDKQQLFLSQYIHSFQTGRLDIYRDSQRTWIRDKGPRVENIFGFVEPYRDPYGIRAEFEGIVGISDPKETKTLTRLVESSSTFIKRLPWVRQGEPENNGKGPFERGLFEPPDFASIHSMPDPSLP